MLNIGNYFKYLPTSVSDESWGLYVLNAGFNKIGKNDIYPSPEHPGHHYFSWNNGRVLHEFQIIYITKGEGVFESINNEIVKVKAGAVLFLFPGLWHRFRPSPQTGWDECWVGCNGPILESLLSKNFISNQEPVQYIGLQESIISLFQGIIQITIEEKPGYQPLVSGMVLHLLGGIHALKQQRTYNNDDRTETVINLAKSVLRTRIDQGLSIESLAIELNVGYAWFRKAFKSYTGIAPNQYLLQLKIEKAKLLLSDPRNSVKDVAYDLKFESVQYFSKLFKDKTGLSPANYRKTA